MESGCRVFQLISENAYVPGFPAVGGRGTAPDYLGKFYYDTFPRDFEWGVGTSAFQTEGAFDTDGNEKDVASAKYSCVDSLSVNSGC